MFAEWQSRATLARLLRVVVALRQEVIFIAKLIFQLLAPISPLIVNLFLNEGRLL